MSDPYEDGYKAGFEDSQLEVKALQKKYALALLALYDAHQAIVGFVRTAIPRRQ